MQGIITHEKVQHILRKKTGSPDKKSKKSGPLVKPIPIKEKIKQQLKDNQRETKEKASNMVKDFSLVNVSNRKDEVLGNEINMQEESFKSRLQKKKLIRGNSQPHNLKAVLIFYLNFKNNILKNTAQDMKNAFQDYSPNITQMKTKNRLISDFETSLKDSGRGQKDVNISY